MDRSQVLGHPVTHAALFIVLAGLLWVAVSQTILAVGILTVLGMLCWAYGVGAATLTIGGGGTLRRIVSFFGFVMGVILLVGAYVLGAIMVAGIEATPGIDTAVVFAIPAIVWAAGYQYQHHRHPTGEGTTTAGTLWDRITAPMRQTPTDYRTGRWNLAVSVGVLTGGLGLVLGSQVLLLAAIAPTILALYAASAATIGPEPTDLAVDRTFSSEEYLPGDEVDVTVTVINNGGERVAQCRLVDGVPQGLTVIDGTPKLSTSLDVGESASTTYTVRMVRGTHEYEPAVVSVRDLASATDRRAELGPEAEIDVRLGLETMPVSPDIGWPGGQVPTDKPGSGVEFHSVREYRPGDPLNRVNWGHFAKTGELATTSFRLHHSTTIILVVDTRTEGAYSTEELATRSAYAAGVMGSGLLERGDTVAAYMLEDGTWIPPGQGDPQAHRITAALEKDADVGELTIEPEQVPSRIPGDAHVLVCSPITDSTIVDFCETIRSYGFSVSVVGPQPPHREDLAGALTDLRRTTRINQLRDWGLDVVDWSRDEPLEIALRRTTT